MTELELNEAYYQKERASLLAKHEGKHIVIYQQRFHGAYDTFESAFNAALNKFGPDAFSNGLVIKEVLSKEPIFFLLQRRPEFVTLREEQVPVLFGPSNPQNLLLDGLKMQIVVDLPAAFRKSGTAAGRTLPAQRILNALIDTGATFTSIDVSVASTLQLPVIGQATVHGVSGQYTAPVYAARITFGSLPLRGYDPIRLHGIRGSPGVEALIGRDLLQSWLLVYNGPHGHCIIAEQPKFGAREMERAVEKIVVEPLAGALLKREIAEGNNVVVDIVDNSLVLKKR